MSNLPIWKTQPIFISSTFTDMMEERDVLRDEVFPELDEKLRERCVRLESIDLRWGVETTSESEQKKKELMVLKVCLDEIDRCKPFFIGIIGDRYGWVPPADRMAEAEKEKGFKTSIANKSVTALEIEYGVLSDVKQFGRSFFFFRDSLPYYKIPLENRSEFADSYNKEFDPNEAEERLNNFKKLIISKVGKENVFIYKADWANGNVCGLEEFKEKVLERLWKELDAQTKELEDTRPKNWQEEERKYLEDFIEDRTICFSGRTELIDDVLDFIYSESDHDNSGLCLTGEAGSGKSALFAWIYKTLKKQKDIFLLGHAAGISPRSGSITNMLILWIQEMANELKTDLKEQLEENPKIEDLRKLFAELLSNTSKNKRVVILVDALNQFERSIHAKYVNWIPETKPSNFKFLFTAIQGEETENLSKRKDIKINELKPVSRIDAQKIVNIICERYHKKLNEETIDILLNKKKSDNTFAYSNPLWLTMAVDEFILLDSDDFDRLKELEGTPEAQLKQLLFLTAQELPADIPGMYNYVFERSRRFGEEFVAKVLSFIGISRYGMRESDLEGLFTFDKKIGWDKLNFASFRRYLRSHLVQKGELGLFDFRHLQLRESLKQGLLKNPDEIKSLHKTMSEYLGNIPGNDPLYQAEIMYHLINSDSADLAANYLAKHSLAVNQLQGVCEIFEEFLLENINYPPNPVNWICINIINNKQLSDEQCVAVCYRMSYNILLYLSNSVRTDVRIKIANAIIRRLEGLKNSEVEAATYIDVYSYTYKLLGDLQNDLGELSSALDSYLLSLEKSEYLYYFNQNSESAALNFSTAHSCVSEQYVRLNEPQKAEKHYKESEKIYQSIIQRAKESIPRKCNYAISLLNQGQLFRKQSFFSKAIEKYNNALQILIEIEGNKNYKDDINSALSVAYESLGEVNSYQSNLDKAKYFYNKALSLRENKYKDEPNSALVIHNLIALYYNIGNVYFQSKELNIVKDFLIKAETLADILLKIDSNSIKHQRASNMIIERWAEYFRRVEDEIKYESYLNQLIENCIKLLKTVPDSEELQFDYSKAMRKKANLCDSRGDTEHAILLLEEVLESYKSKIPETNYYKKVIVLLLSSLTKLYLKNSEIKRAQKCIEDKIEFCEYVLSSDSENKKYREEFVNANNELNSFILSILQLYKQFIDTNPERKNEVFRDYKNKIDFLKERGVKIPEKYISYLS